MVKTLSPNRNGSQTDLVISINSLAIPLLMQSSTCSNTFSENHSNSHINQEKNNHCLRAIYFIIAWIFNNALEDCNKEHVKNFVFYMLNALEWIPIWLADCS